MYHRRLMSLLMLVFSISPILAPLAGSVLIEWSGWRSVFWAVTAAAILGLGLLAAFLPETRASGERLNSSMRTALSGYFLLLHDRRLFLSALAAFRAFLCTWRTRRS